MGIDDIAEWITGEWAVISHAPITFIASLAVITFLVWKVVQHEFSNRLANAASKQELADARVQDYERKLAGATPDEAKAQLDKAHARIEAMEQTIGSMAPRRVSDEQKAILYSKLSSAPGHISVGYVMGTTDGLALQRDFTGIFQQAGWDVSNSTVMTSVSPGASLRISLHEDTPASRNVPSALSDAGFECDVHTQPAPGLHKLDASILIYPIDC